METKKKRVALTFILLFALTVGCNQDEYKNEYPFSYEELILPQLQCMNMDRPEGSWNYPVYPGMSEWSQFKTSQEMLDACQVPEERLKKMSTQAVIQAIWESPFFISSPLLGNYYQFGSDILASNAYKELIKRKDAGKSLLERFALIDPVLTEPAARAMVRAFELLISQTEFLSQLNDKEKKKIIEITLKNIRLRQQEANDTYDPFLTSFLLMGRTMLNAGYLPFIEETNNNEQLESFLKQASRISQENETFFMQRILFHGENFIK